MRARLIVSALVAAMAMPQVGWAESYSGESYPASQLVEPCQDADSDAREVGQAAEIECEQYIMGFVDALAEIGVAGQGKEICIPAVNTADEVRWAFVRWVYGDFTKRRAMPAADALLAALRDTFACN